MRRRVGANGKPTTSGGRKTRDNRHMPLECSSVRTPMIADNRLHTVIAMHGWAGDARAWDPWIEATALLGWQWDCGERGYGTLQQHVPRWPAEANPGGRRLVLAHSLGIHLLPDEVLTGADGVVLLASFGAFVPPGHAARRVQATLRAMACKLSDECEAAKMLRGFLRNAASPEPSSDLPRGPVDDGQMNLARLREDLDLLASRSGLPECFPRRARVLVVEAGRDEIVAPEARALLREQLPSADILRLDEAGHALLHTGILEATASWVKSWA